MNVIWIVVFTGTHKIVMAWFVDDLNTDEIEITEEMLQDGAQIAKAIQRLDFLSIAPLSPPEEAFFETLLFISEQIMEAMHKTEELEPDTLEELADYFRTELLNIRNDMEKVGPINSSKFHLRNAVFSRA